MNYGLKDNTVSKIQEVLAKYPQISQAVLYGSRAKGSQKNGSDIDLVLNGENLDLSIMTKVNNDLDDLMLPYMFDISIYDQINNQDLLDHIERVGKEIYKA